jgi:chromosome segregation protein
MRLKRLELYGYKSFATRSTFEFGEGLTAVVGPNGSGKSNVADAIRWVMGEQSYRSLRAKTTNDMIFAGSRGRARLGMAEVLVTLDNADGYLPIDYSEVTVGRRAFRSGENEYLINGNRVRYRDVLDILGGAGLARSNYTVIGQGMVDQALALTPEARRAMFEEAAGIAPQLRKREEALRRIQETERNLERVQDILSELRPRAARLRRQAERAEEYLLLRQDLEELQRIWYGYHWQRCQHDLAAANATLAERQAHQGALQHYTDGFQARQEELAVQQADQRQAIEDLRRGEAALRDQSEEHRRQLAVEGERLRLFQQQQRSVAAEIEALQGRRDILQGEIAKAGQEMAEQETALAASQAELEAARQELSRVDATRRGLSQAAQRAQEQLTVATTAASRQRARLEQEQRRRETLLGEIAEAEGRRATVEERLGRQREQAQSLAARELALAARLEELTQARERLERELAQAREAIQSAREEVARQRDRRDRLVARYDLLTRQRQELSGFVPGVREVLAAKEKLSGILGSVVNLVEVPRELEGAIEAALGARLQNIITERWEDAEAAINYLKDGRRGWATFLPLDTIRPGAPLRVAPDGRIVGVASELVRYDERLRPAVELLLGRTLVVRELKDARELLRQRTGASLLVTLQGETVQPNGVLSGGNRHERSNLLEQEREWRQLPERIEAARADLAEATQALEGQQQQARALDEELKGHERALAAQRRERETSREAAARQAQELREAEREAQWLATRLERAQKEAAEGEAQGQALRGQLAQAQQEEARLSAALSDVRQQLAAADDESLRRRVGELETRAAVARRTVQAQRTLIESHRGNLDQIGGQIEAKAAQEAQLVAAVQAHTTSTADHRAHLEALAARIEAQRQEQEPARAALAELERAQREFEAQRAEALERLHEAELAASRAQMEQDRVKDRQATLALEIEGELGPVNLPETVSHQLRLTLGDATVELPAVPVLPGGLGDDIRQLKARIRRLGNVNEEAPQEYEQLLERQTFLDSQTSDLRGAIGALHEVIQELDTVIERDFAATVRQVNEAFNTYFGALFSGGTARLVLTDPDNLSTTGVDILAHPPGKRPQSLSLLSGGERALTAVALIFALLKANPVPFCFLDEVDAALDEANVARFRDLLTGQSAETQFIVITHNRRTIEAAATIYGISMGEVGVSQCVSLKLDGATVEGAEELGAYTQAE